MVTHVVQESLDRVFRRRLTAPRFEALVADPPSAPGAPLRILVTSGSAELYGSDRMLLEAVAGFVERGHEVHVALGADGALVPLLEKAGAHVRVVEVPVLRRAYLSASGLVELGRLVRRSLPAMRQVVKDVRPDVVYVNTLTLPVWQAVVRAARRPLVVHVHEAEAGRARAVRTALAAPLVVADSIIFNSRHSYDLARRDLGPTLPPSVVVLNGVETDADAPAPRQDLNDPVKLIYVGRLSPRKGVDVAVEAVRLLVDRGRDVQLDVVGEVFEGYEWFRTQLEETMAAEPLTSRVVLHGFHPQVRDFVRAADIALVPTRRDEPFGNVLVEGVGAKRPMVAAAQPGLLEAGTGLRSVIFVRPDDAAALADAVERQIDGWAEQREFAVQDARELLSRHAPSSYRARVSAIVEATAGHRTRP